MIRVFTILLFFLFFYNSNLYSQIIINEVSCTNFEQITDEDGDSPDWIELLNISPIPQSLKGYKIADSPESKNPWVLPKVILYPGDRIMVFASGKSRPSTLITNGIIDHWETAVLDENLWKYKVGDSTIPANWNIPGFITNTWNSGKGGIGYGDNDDLTEIPEGSISVYAVTSFDLYDSSIISSAIFNMDYDDGFVAYLNGVEIARAGLTGPQPAWDQFAIKHEANLYNGGLPTQFNLDVNFIKSILVEGTNYLAIQVHNVEAASSDLSMRPFLHFGINTTDEMWGPNPSWFDEDGPGSSGELHTNFKLKAGETLTLWNATGTIVDSITLIPIDRLHSRARIPDGTEWCITDTPTPNASNDTAPCFKEYAAKPSFELPSGFYNGNQIIYINGNDIRYTIDGSSPDLNSPQYLNLININETTVIKAKTFETGKLPSEVATATYFINEKTELPVVSISAAPGDLFIDGSGGPAVYDNYSSGEKASCNVSYFDKNKNLKFEENASVKVVGNWSVGFDQKSMQFIFDEDYGAKDDVPNALFKSEKPFIKKLHGFRVRNMDDDTNLARMRDPLANQIALPTNATATASQNVAVFINGDYWGHYSARELLNDYFFRDNFKTDADSLDIIKTNYNTGTIADHGTIEGFNSMVEFMTNNDFSDPALYSQAKELIDIENWVDYWATEIYVANGDWYSSVWYNNIQAFKSYAPDLKWRFVLWDLAYSQGNGQFDCEASYNSLNTALAKPVKKNIYSPMFNALLMNNEFKNYFINRFADLINYYWSTEKVHSIIQKNVEEMDSEIQPTYERWDPVCNGYCPPDYDSWIENVEVLKDFYVERPGFQRTHINNYFGLGGEGEITLDVFPAGAGKIKISTITPDKLPWTGTYFMGNPVKITAIPNPGYTFTNWTSSEFISDSTNIEHVINLDQNISFTANFSGGPLALNLTFSEINYNSDSTTNSGNWVELHNFGNTPVDISAYGFTAKNSSSIYTFPLNTVIPAGGYLVLADDLEKFKDQYPGVSYVIGPTGIKLENDQDTIYLLDKSLQFVLTASYFDDLPWPQTADGYGRTLENAFESDITHLMDPEGWFDGCMGGSPGQAYSPCQEEIIFNEINYNSPDDHRAGDWIELTNTTDQDIDISGWNIVDGQDNDYFEFPQGTIIKPDSFLVIYSDLDSFQSVHPETIPLVGPFEFGLSSNGDIIRLFDDSGRLYLSMFYNDAAPWPKEPDGSGPTLELIVPGTDLNRPENWEASCFNGTPGRPNTDCTTATNELSQMLIKVSPNPSKGIFSIIAENGNIEKWKLSDISGKLILAKSKVDFDSFNLDLTNQSTNIYILQLVSSEGIKTIKLVVE